MTPQEDDVFVSGYSHFAYYSLAFFQIISLHEHVRSQLREEKEEEEKEEEKIGQMCTWQEKKEKWEYMGKNLIYIVFGNLPLINDHIIMN